MEGLSVADSEMAIYLHPSHLKNVSQAILRHLSSLLFKFNETFDGVVLAYAVNELDKQAKVISGVYPYLAVKLKAQLLLFSPKPEMVLEGKVLKVTPESIHAVVLGFASAIIMNEDIRNEFRYKIKGGEGLYASRPNKHHKIKVGTIVRFVVKSLDEGIMHILGSLTPAHTGSSQWLDKNMEDDINHNKTRTAEEQTATLEHSMIAADTSSLKNDNHESRKSKKRRIAKDM